ncbi:MAG: hypothetical protein J6333_03510 [Planctomycetes bacterium]|nr:hypothetical protein [Planctomycetota bacterium]
MLGLRLLCGVPLFFVMVGLLCLDAHCRVGWTLAGLLALFTVFGVREFCHFSRVLGNHPFVNWATAFGCCCSWPPNSPCPARAFGGWTWNWRRSPCSSAGPF